MKHNTTRPDGVEMETKVERVLADLRELDSVRMAEKAEIGRNTFKVMGTEPTPGDVPSDALRVLAEHDAFIHGRQSWSGPTVAAIHLED